MKAPNVQDIMKFNKIPFALVDWIRDWSKPEVTDSPKSSNYCRIVALVISLLCISDHYVCTK